MYLCAFVYQNNKVYCKNKSKMVLHCFVRSRLKLRYQHLEDHMMSNNNEEAGKKVGVCVWEEGGGHTNPTQ